MRTFMNFTANTLMLVGFLVSGIAMMLLMIIAAWHAIWCFFSKFFSHPVLWWTMLCGSGIFILGLIFMFFSPEKPDESIVGKKD